VSFLSRMMAPRQRRAQAFTEPFWSGWFPASRSGQNVTVETALQVTTVLACLRVIAEGVAQVPLNLHRKRKAGGSDVADDHPLHWLLSTRPNAWQTSFEFFEQLVFHTALCGRFIAFKNVVRGEVKELIPFLPHEVCVDVDQFRRPIYRVSSEITGQSQDFPASAIWHVKGPSWNGVDGLKPLQLAREAIGLAMATEEAHALMHANGAQATGIYSVDDKLLPDQFLALRNWVEKNMTGDARFRPMILDRGAKFMPTSMTGVDAQHLETRKHQIEEICRAFKCFPQMIGHTDKTATFASAEAFFLAHVVHCLSPWYRRIEQSINANLLTDTELRDGLHSKFNPNALMRGAARDRAEFYFRLWSMGALNANEIRALEDQNPYEGGEIYRAPVNMGDASDPELGSPSMQPGAGGTQAPSPAPAPKKTDASASMLRHY
jgi:HK97 family phage portal protein